MKAKLLGVLLLLIAFGLLIPGLTKPIISLTATVDKAALVELGKQTLASDPDVPTFVITLSEQVIDQLDVTGEIEAFSKTRSIIGTVEELYRADNLLVAFLIALFSVVIPVTKSILLLFSAVASQHISANWADKIGRLISKWSMADVFVIAIIVTYLATNATQQTEELFSLVAVLADGFYYFLGYCILSILSAQLMQPRGAVLLK